MPSVYIFRGKSATGKTTLSSILSRHLNIAVLRKDDIFDPLSTHLDNQTNSRACYDILASMLSANISAGADVIVDIALPHNPHYMKFLSKIDFREHRPISFLCGCSDERLLLSRWERRLKNPLPNQFYQSIDAINAHYASMDIAPLPGEVCFDSARNLEDLKLDLFEKVERLRHDE